MDKSKAIKMLQFDKSLTLTAVANKLNVSREYIRQVADDIPGASRHKKKYCSSCGVRIFSDDNTCRYERGFCLICWPTERDRRKKERWEASHIKLLCEICGKEFWRSRSTVRRNIQSGYKHIWCSKLCQGKWLGEHYWQFRKSICLDCGQPRRRIISYVCDNCGQKDEK